MSHLDAGAEAIVSDDLRRRLDHDSRHVRLPPVIDATKAIAINASQEQRGLAVWARFSEKSDAPVWRTPRDKIFAQEANRRRGLPRHEVVRKRKRDPAVLTDECSHWSVALDTSHKLVLLASHHCPAPLVAETLNVHPGSIRPVDPRPWYFVK
jgi:hypothetical protein